MKKNESLEKLKINRIKIVLTEKEISQKELAGKLGMTPNSLSKICNNITQPSLTTLHKIAFELNVDIKDLLYSTEVL